jgi:regulator of replication initiation timing
MSGNGNFPLLLFSVMEMPHSELKTYFESLSNVLNFQKSLHVIYSRITTNDLLRMQEKLAALSKQHSQALFEVASLKKSISDVEIENAKLTIELLNLRRQHESPAAQELEKDHHRSPERRLESELAESKKTIEILEAVNNKWKLKVEERFNYEFQLRAELEKLKARTDISGRVKKLGDKLRKQKPDQDLSESINTEQINERLKSGFVGLAYRFQKQLHDLEQLVLRKFKRILNSVSFLRSRLQPIMVKTVQLVSLASGVYEKAKASIARTEQHKSLLVFAIQAMAKLAGASFVSMPSIDSVLDHPNLLEQYFTRLKAIASDRIEIQQPTAIILPSPDIKRVLTVMNDLMSTINEQMQEEHEELMGVLTEQSLSSSFFF